MGGFIYAILFLSLRRMRRFTNVFFFHFFSFINFYILFFLIIFRNAFLLQRWFIFYFYEWVILILFRSLLSSVFVQWYISFSLHYIGMRFSFFLFFFINFWLFPFLILFWSQRLGYLWLRSLINFSYCHFLWFLFLFFLHDFSFSDISLMNIPLRGQAKRSLSTMAVASALTNDFNVLE